MKKTIVLFLFAFSSFGVTAKAAIPTLQEVTDLFNEAGGLISSDYDTFSAQYFVIEDKTVDFQDYIRAEFIEELKAQAPSVFSFEYFVDVNKASIEKTLGYSLPLDAGQAEDKDQDKFQKAIKAGSKKLVQYLTKIKAAGFIADSYENSYGSCSGAYFANEETSEVLFLENCHSND